MTDEYPDPGEVTHADFARTWSPAKDARDWEDDGA